MDPFSLAVGFLAGLLAGVVFTSLLAIDPVRFKQETEDDH
jgi:hypothetical protein